jgi:tetratricopeptide (TPR) repeat protein
MGTRDLLLVIGFLRSAKMFPSALPFKDLPTQRSLKIVHQAIAEQELALFGRPDRIVDADDLKRRATLTSWTGEPLSIGTRIGEAPDPGVLLCLLYDGPVADAALPVDVFTQTLRRFALRDPVLRGRFDEHVARAGTFVPPWLSPEVRQKNSLDAFNAAMRVAREEGFAHAAPLFEGVRGDAFPQAQVALAVYERRELGDSASALRRLNEVIRVAPRNVAARMQRAAVLMHESGRRTESAADYLAVLREMERPDSPAASREVKEAATQGLWELHEQYAAPAELQAALALVDSDPEQGFEALSRYVDTHPCAWDAQRKLAALALRTERFELVVKLLRTTRWLFPDDSNAHFTLGQAHASLGRHGLALGALERATALSPDDPDIAHWMDFVKRRLELEQAATAEAPSVQVAEHVARSLLLVLGIVRGGHVYPSAMVLHKLPGDVALAIVLLSISQLERRRFPPPPGESSRTPDTRLLTDRTELCDYAGEALGVEQTVGDVPDPGVVFALLYEPSERNAEGKFERAPAAEEGFGLLYRVCRTDSELHAKLDRHLRSPESSLKARLLAGVPHRR